MKKIFINILMCICFVLLLNINSYAEITGDESKEEILNYFIEKTSFMEEDSFIERRPYSRNIMLSYISDSFKESFINDKPDNTEEKWDSMSDYEKYIYGKFYMFPKGMIDSANFKTPTNEEEFFELTRVNEELDYALTGYCGEEEGMILADAQRDVMRWQWKYYEKNGYITNILSNEQEEFFITTEVGLDEDKTEKNEKTTQDEKFTNGEDDTEENEEINPYKNLLNTMKKYWFTLALALIVGIALAIITIKNKKARADEEDED